MRFLLIKHNFVTFHVILTEKMHYASQMSVCVVF